MEKEKIGAFTVMGIATRTHNADGQAAKDIGALWARFMSEGVAHKIPNKTEDTVFAVYTGYESDHTAPYTVVIGCKVAPGTALPEGMSEAGVSGGEYAKFQAHGNLSDGAVGQAWLGIWQSGLNRAYQADFEAYGPKAANPQDAEVDIFVGLA